jgi:hypothetical protein
MKALIFRETGEPSGILKLAEGPYSAFGSWRSARPSAAEPDQPIESAHGARTLTGAGASKGTTNITTGLESAVADALAVASHPEP